MRQGKMKRGSGGGWGLSDLCPACSMCSAAHSGQDGKAGDSRNVSLNPYILRPWPVSLQSRSSPGGLWKGHHLRGSPDGLFKG